MIRISKRSARLLTWRYLRWAIAIPTLPLVWWACTSHPLTQPIPAPEMQTDIYITVAPVRDLDLVFMVDNSPSMGPKQTKMNNQFPKLIDALRDPTDRTLPNLHVAIIDSDLGTNGNFTDPACGPKNGSGWGDSGHFQMINASGCGVTSPDALFLDYEDSGKTKNFTGEIQDVFTCLAGGLGTSGCGEEHQLQAFEFALLVPKIGNDEQVQLFLRPSAYLGLVFLTDEDDCSAASNDTMFVENDKTLAGESASLRCSTRAHQCAGKNLADENPPGYPTTGAFQALWSDCAARTDDCPNGMDNASNLPDFTKPTTCSPLRSIKTMANEIKSLKSDPDQILVAGIFGYPLTDADKATAQYQIALVPNPNDKNDPSHSHPYIYDYWPVCYDPNYKPAAATTDSTTQFDQTAAGNGATGGLRLAAFVDEFGTDNGLKFSICQTDFSDSMSQIGQAIAKKLQNLCVNYKLMDTDLTTPGLQPDCRVVYMTKVQDPSDSTKQIYKEYGEALPECPSGASTANPPDKDCWMLTTDMDKCKVNGQLITVLRTADEIAQGPLTPGTKVGMNCRTCTDEIAALDHASDEYKKCHY